jgi:anti-sigma-K factor RskA
MAEPSAQSGSTEEAAVGHGRKLDDLMLAMDVVDTLRHNRRLVERELSSESRDAELVERLREIYAAQGIDIPDRILLDGVAALKEQRFAFEPPPPSFATQLAKVYVTRGKWGWPLIIGAAALAILWGGYHLAFERPRQAAQERQAIELTQEIPEALTSLQAEVAELAQVEDAKQRARALAEDGLAAARSGDPDAAHAAERGLRNLRDRLAGTYEIRIVSRPGEPSGVWRVPDANPSAKNYYLIAEAIRDDGQIIAVPITSEEDGVTRSVDKWGLRVERAVFDAVRDDKADDGIIQSNRLGIKRRGYLDPDYSVPTTGDAILEW